jgi:translation initiation factor IF-1
VTPAGREKAITLKTPEELQVMYEANQIVAGVLSMLIQEMKPGLSTWQLDRWAEQYCRDHGAAPAFKGYRGFPASLCVSINEQVVHGIPSKRVKVREGDIVSVDFGTLYKGFYGDSAVTIPVGAIQEPVRALLTVTENSLYKAIEQVRIGNRVRTFDPQKISPVDKTDAMQLAQREEIRLHEGDRIRWTQNDKDRGLNNNDIARVVSADPSGIRVEASDGTRSTEVTVAPISARTAA